MQALHAPQRPAERARERLVACALLTHPIPCIAATGRVQAGPPALLAEGSHLALHLMDAGSAAELLCARVLIAEEQALQGVLLRAEQRACGGAMQPVCTTASQLRRSREDACVVRGAEHRASVIAVCEPAALELPNSKTDNT